MANPIPEAEKFVECILGVGRVLHQMGSTQAEARPGVKLVNEPRDSLKRLEHGSPVLLGLRNDEGLEPEHVEALRRVLIQREQAIPLSYHLCRFAISLVHQVDCSQSWVAVGLVRTEPDGTGVVRERNLVVQLPLVDHAEKEMISGASALDLGAALGQWLGPNGVDLEAQSPATTTTAPGAGIGLGSLVS